MLASTAEVPSTTTIEKVLGDPRRLVDALSGADDDDQALEALGREFQISEQAAILVLDQQFRLLTRVGAAGLHATSSGALERERQGNQQ